MQYPFAELQPGAHFAETEKSIKSYIKSEFRQVTQKLVSQAKPKRQTEKDIARDRKRCGKIERITAIMAVYPPISQSPGQDVPDKSGDRGAKGSRALAYN